MMGAVKIPVQARMMHQPVRPVEIGVMSNDDRHKADGEIADAGGLEVRIDREHAANRAEHDADPGQGENDPGPQRGEDFAMNVGARCEPLLNLAPAKASVPEQFQDQGHAAGRNHVAADIQNEIRGPDLPETGQGFQESLHRKTPSRGRGQTTPVLQMILNGGKQCSRRSRLPEWPNSKSASRFRKMAPYSAAMRSLRPSCSRRNSLGVMPVLDLEARLKGPSD